LLVCRIAARGKDGQLVGIPEIWRSFPDTPNMDAFPHVALGLLWRVSTASPLVVATQISPDACFAAIPGFHAPGSGVSDEFIPPLEAHAARVRALHPLAVAAGCGWLPRATDGHFVVEEIRAAVSREAVSLSAACRFMRVIVPSTDRLTSGQPATIIS
jgi:hypothetical protein